MTKIKASITAAVAIVTLATVLIAQHETRTNLAQARLREENDALRKQLAQTQAMAQQQAQPDNAGVSDSQQLEEALRELLKLRGEVGWLRKELQAASAESNQPVQAAAEENLLTNVISGFTPLQASVRSQVASGQALVVGGWPGHRGERVFVLALPKITGENADQVAVQFSAMEIPERILADFGLDDLQIESTWSALSTVIPADQAEALHRTFKETDDADFRGEHLKWIGTASVNSTNGQPVSLNCVLASYGQIGVLASSVDGKYGDNLRVRGSDAEIDLGPYSGPTFTVTPVILNDRNSIDLAMQATVFWRFDEAF